MNILDIAFKIGSDLSILDAVFNVRKNPVLYMPVHGRFTMHKRNARSVPPEIKRGNRSRVLPSDHQNIKIVVGMRIVVVMMYLRQLFTGNTEIVRQIIIARCHHQLARMMRELTTEAVGNVDAEITIRT